MVGEYTHPTHSRPARRNAPPGGPIICPNIYLLKLPNLRGILHAVDSLRPLSRSRSSAAPLLRAPPGHRWLPATGYWRLLFQIEPTDPWPLPTALDFPKRSHRCVRKTTIDHRPSTHQLPDKTNPARPSGYQPAPKNLFHETNPILPATTFGDSTYTIAPSRPGRVGVLAHRRVPAGKWWANTPTLHIAQIRIEMDQGPNERSVYICVDLWLPTPRFRGP